MAKQKRKLASVKAEQFDPQKASLAKSVAVMEVIEKFLKRLTFTADEVPMANDAFQLLRDLKAVHKAAISNPPQVQAAPPPAEA